MMSNSPLFCLQIIRDNKQSDQISWLMTTHATIGGNKGNERYKSKLMDDMEKKKTTTQN